MPAMAAQNFKRKAPLDLSDTSRVIKTARNLITSANKGKLETFDIEPLFKNSKTNKNVIAKPNLNNSRVRPSSTTSSVDMTVDQPTDDTVKNSNEEWIFPKKVAKVPAATNNDNP